MMSLQKEGPKFPQGGGQAPWPSCWRWRWLLASWDHKCHMMQNVENLRTWSQANKMIINLNKSKEMVLSCLAKQRIGLPCLTTVWCYWTCHYFQAAWYNFVEWFKLGSTHKRYMCKSCSMALLPETVETRWVTFWWLLYFYLMVIWFGVCICRSAIPLCSESDLGRMFFCSVTVSDSCLHDLLPQQRDSEILSRLRWLTTTNYKKAQLTQREARDSLGI